MNRRLRLLTSVLAVATMGLSACGSTGDDVGAVPASTDEPRAVPHSDDSDVGIVRIGWIEEVPRLVIGGDRWVYAPAPVDRSGSSGSGFRMAPEMAPPPPAATPMVRRRLTVRGLDAVLDRADELGLLADPDEYAAPLITDVGTAHVSFTVGSGTYEHSAYALGIEEETGNRARLLSFLHDVDDLEALVGADEVGPVEAWEPERYVVSTGRAIHPADVDSERMWPEGLEVVEGCVALTADRFPDGIAGIYVAMIDHGSTRDAIPTAVQVVPDLPGDICS